MIEEEEVLDAEMEKRIDAIGARMGRLEKSVKLLVAKQAEFHQPLGVDMAKHLGHVSTENFKSYWGMLPVTDAMKKHKVNLDDEKYNRFDVQVSHGDTGREMRVVALDHCLEGRTFEKMSEKVKIEPLPNSGVVTEATIVKEQSTKTAKRSVLQIRRINATSNVQIKMIYEECDVKRRRKKNISCLMPLPQSNFVQPPAALPRRGLPPKPPDWGNSMDRDEKMRVMKGLMHCLRTRRPPPEPPPYKSQIYHQKSSTRQKTCTTSWTLKCSPDFLCVDNGNYWNFPINSTSSISLSLEDKSVFLAAANVRYQVVLIGLLLMQSVILIYIHIFRSS